MSTTIASVQTQSPQPVLARLLWVAPLTIAASAVANLAVYYAGSAIIPEIGAWPGTGPLSIVIATAVYLLLGSIILALIAWRSSRPARHFLIVAVAGLVLSLPSPIFAGLGYGPPGVPSASLAVVLCLELMHIVAFAISVPLFLRLALKR
jgi:hypothetical protein